MCSCVRNCSISICSLQFYILYYTLPLYQRLHQSTLASAHCTLYSLSVRTFRIMYTLRINQLYFILYIFFFFFSSFKNSCSVAFVLFIVLIGVSIVTLIIIIIIIVISYTQCIEHGDCGVYVHVMQLCGCIQQQQQQKYNRKTLNFISHVSALNACIGSCSCTVKLVSLLESLHFIYSLSTSSGCVSSRLSIHKIMIGAKQPAKPAL